MNDNRKLDNMEEKRTIGGKNEKTTHANNREKGGLNDGNPNADATPPLKEGKFNDDKKSDDKGD